ncbi:baseplate J/gp47 family protein [Polycladidibacter hongkongensis]|uniref:baseplate J/gp47 family protein n=1 Tax=Polycladidibacter hongkongensis TaxID=1647556 RepID=UPI000836C547|nr:baseplate J/gp47 family protein [Pseudovibrio hongkongensis]
MQTMKLPPPTLVPYQDPEAILAEMMVDVRARFAAVGIDYDLGDLETDPVKIIFEAAAYRAALLGDEINAAYAGHLIDYASPAGLTELGEFYDRPRRVGESDAEYAAAIKRHIAGRSAGGPAERYAAIAFDASPDVRDVKIYSDPHGIDPAIHVAVLSSATGGHASGALLQQVETALMAQQVTSDRFHVASAVRKTVDVALDIWLTPEASESILDDLAGQLRLWWDAQDLLGLDLNHADIIAAVKSIGAGAISNVRVVAPVGDTEAWPAEALALGEISIHFMGRGR